ncbi:hypothetical protein CMI37_13825 [Candidatus Pacearchaeota archaeon]|nr:hypothetical protein [Candidatus Pacearchaeota archaeon]
MPAGRPSKLTDEMKAKIIRFVRAGNYYNVACRAAGVGERTFMRWMEMGREAKSGRFRQFWQEVLSAEAEAEALHVLNITKAGVTDWKASARFLAAKYPDRWAEKRAIDITSGGKRIKGYAVSADPANWNKDEEIDGTGKGTGD